MNSELKDVVYIAVLEMLEYSDLKEKDEIAKYIADNWKDIINNIQMGLACEINQEIMNGEKE